MTEVTIEKVEQNSEAILELVGKDSFISWDKFTHNSSELVKAIEDANKSLAIFR